MIQPITNLGVLAAFTSYVRQRTCLCQERTNLELSHRMLRLFHGLGNLYTYSAVKETGVPGTVFLEQEKKIYVAVWTPLR